VTLISNVVLAVTSLDTKLDTNLFQFMKGIDGLRSRLLEPTPSPELGLLFLCLYDCLFQSLCSTASNQNRGIGRRRKSLPIALPRLLAIVNIKRQVVSDDDDRVIFIVFVGSICSNSWKQDLEPLLNAVAIPKREPYDDSDLFSQPPVDFEEAIDDFCLQLLEFPRRELQKTRPTEKEWYEAKFKTTICVEYFFENL
jgi:hypothetical protein